MFVIILTPEPTREYGEPQALGPFNSGEEAAEHLARYVDVGEGWLGAIVRVENPIADESDAEEETTRETGADEPMREITPGELVAAVRAEGDRLRDDRVEASDAVAVCRAIDALRLELRAGALELADIAKDVVGAIEGVGFER